MIVKVVVLRLPALWQNLIELQKSCRIKKTVQNLRGIIYSQSYSMSSFFFKEQENEDNLQYDNTAFLHFAISVCCLTAILFLVLIYRQYRQKRIPHLKTISKMLTFKDKLHNTNQIKKNYFTSTDFLIKFVVVLLALLAALFCYSQISEDSKMIGFDPYEILGVPLDADIVTIKKSYRKLALIYHPDRNTNNPEVAAKFIQISKAYECLTDEQAKQKCQKYGNPDGATSFKVGIGLPRFMVQVGNQYFILVPIFFFLLFVVPRAFIKWSNRIKPMDSQGNLLVNYPNLYVLMNQNVNIITLAIMFGIMKELDPVFAQKKALDENTATEIRNLLVACRAFTPEVANSLDMQVLYRIATIYHHLADKQRNLKISEVTPEICHKLMMFSLTYAQKMLHGQPLLGEPSWPIKYLGVYPIKLISFFSKQMFNPSIRLGDVRSIEFLQLTPDEVELAKNIPIGNLHANLLWDDQKINTLVSNFIPSRQSFIREQIECLPALKLEGRIMLGDEEVREMTVDDFATVEIKITRKKQTLGYVVAKDYPYLVNETFNLIVSYNNNLMFFSPVVFKQGENEIVFKFPHRQNVVLAMKFDIALMSSNYPNMEIETELFFEVTPAIQNRKLEIHQEDMSLEKIPKNFFESLASMDALNEEERELSEGSDEDAQQREATMNQEPMRKPNKMRCCDDH